MKMVSISLLATCMIGGLPRSPVEGVQTVPEDEAKRLVEANMAEFADISGDDGEDGVAGDDLDDKTVAQLTAIAKEESVTLPDKPKKADIVAAIRAKRDAADDRLDAMDEAKLRETAAAETVAVADEAKPEDIIAAIRAKRAEA